ncbi:ABC transporter substrate-binding protein [Glutamicibacter sp. V16R2B1]|uniref:ABC transporter substrate-binding protein n=1 Tax=Glutamicibacter sp. V16R2B1 TaxID=2036207 RepID=UPI0010FE97B7|nr:ABC transporter substrate-binding protein [Glutamicibacter sp. V16R2B1]TLK54022.1 nitrate ABC transporter substrate-binding protein [Glutamicibacter sp. V16R2B1]
MKHSLKLALSSLAVLTLVACGSGSPSDGEKTVGADGNDKLEHITVGVIPIVDTAPIWLGDEKGFFEEEGLDLTIETASGGAAIVPGIQSGSYDYAFSNLISLMVANDKGLEMKVVANGITTTGDANSDVGSVLVKEGSDIKSPRDLEGKKVSVNNLSNIGDTTVSELVARDGGDPDNVEFVEVGFSDAPAALENGIVDAAWILEPFQSVAIEGDAKKLVSNFAEFDPELDVAVYFTSAKNAAENPEVTEKFTRAMNRSLEYAQENPDEVRDIVGNYTEINEEVRAKMVLPRFRTEINRDTAQKLGDAAHKYGTLENTLDLEKLLP